MGFISTDTAQSKKYAIGSIHNGLKVLFCSRHATPLIIIIMQNCRNWTMTKDLEESVNACWYILSRVCLSCCQFAWLHSCIYGVVSVQQFHSVLVGHGDISVLHLIKSEVSAYPIVVIYFCGCVSGMFVPSYTFSCFISILRKLDCSLEPQPHGYLPNMATLACPRA